jgi:hypothetical protein
MFEKLRFGPATARDLQSLLPEVKISSVKSRANLRGRDTALDYNCTLIFFNVRIRNILVDDRTRYWTAYTSKCPSTHSGTIRVNGAGLQTWHVPDVDMPTQWRPIVRAK